MYVRDLADEKNDRLEQAARALLAAVYDPITTQASWPDIQHLNRMSFDRLMQITALAVENFRAQTSPLSVPREDVQRIMRTAFEPSEKLLALGAKPN